jgi:ApbE superfamily uncharacterized protein (UPF0280 family)
MKKQTRKNIHPTEYRKRQYRQAVSPEGLVSSFVTVQETDLHILATEPVAEEAWELILYHRNQLECYIQKRPEFLSSLVPLEADPLAPELAKKMIEAAGPAGVGPMAAVAGAIAEYVGKGLLAKGCREVIVENGGDIFLARRKECVVSIFAGQSPLNQKVGLRIEKGSQPMGICTSSGKIGHSLSLGKADSVTVLAKSTLLADAAATRLGNEVPAAADEKAISRALEIAQNITGLLGVVIICDQQMGAWGEINLVKL